MKVLIVNSMDIVGGAARAAYRLHRSLLDEGIHSQMLVQQKSGDDFSVIGPATKIKRGLGKIRPALDALPLRGYPNRSKTPFSPAWVPFSHIVNQINALDPDIVHLHWVAGGMMRVEDIARIKAPVVWSLHDMWAFTGGCHYDESCGAFRKICGSCKVLASNVSNDLSREVFTRKRKAFLEKPDITVVGLSRWLADEASSSALFATNKVVNLPNPIDVNIFSPFNRLKARELLNLPEDRKLILFGAMGAASDPRKGFPELRRALEHLTTPDAELVVFGASQPQEGAAFNQKAHYLGRLYDDVTLRVLYSAADVMVVPSLQENLSNAIMESLACGTPVVGFDIGGNSDLIDHNTNGYLAEPFDINDLAQGIDWVLDTADHEILSTNARNKVLHEFDSKVVAPKYIELYRSVLVEEVI